jgi:hypothetical protein
MMKIRLLVSLFLVALLWGVTCAFGATYYVDADMGSDTHSGISAELAWKSLENVNSTTFMPGDSILLKAGTEYAGLLAPKGSGALVDGRPVLITIGKWGQGPAPRIDGLGKVLDTVLLQNVEYWDIHDLEITNHGEQTQPWRTGVHVLADSGRALHGIHLSNLFVHDVNGDLTKDQEGSGIYFEARVADVARGVSRFDGLVIENCHVLRTDRNGICQRKTGGGSAERSFHVIIRNNLLEDIGGDGIKLWGSNGGIIEHNRVRGGGMRCKDASAGIWPFACDDALTQFNEVSGMRCKEDGEGFDSDYVCRRSVFQFNYSHDNAGGFMLICSPGKSYCQHSVIRYNVSQNDGTNGGWVFNIAGNTTDSLIYNNLIFTGAGKKLNLLHYAKWDGGIPRRSSFFNNIFYAQGSVGYDWGPSRDNVFDFNVFCGNHNNPPPDAHAIRSMPSLTRPGGGGEGFASLSAYRWLAGAVVPRGRTIPDASSRDFFGNLLEPDRRPCVGIEEVGR